jgi:hypothetical protein
MTTTPQLPQPAPNAPTSAATGRRRTGKVAQLPKPLRDRINHMLEDGVTYARIIETLGDDAKDLSLNCLSQWKQGGHQDWLKDQFWRDEMRARQEAFTELLAADPVQLPEAGLQLAATGICDLLREFCEISSAEKVDSDKYVRVANSLARLSRSILHLQQYRDTQARIKTAELKHRTLDRDVAERERAALLDKTDDLFGFKSATRLASVGDTGGAGLPLANGSGAAGVPPLNGYSPSTPTDQPASFPSSILDPQSSPLSQTTNPTTGLAAPPQFEVQASDLNVQASSAIQAPPSQISNPKSQIPPASANDSAAPLQFEVQSSEFKVQSSEFKVQGSEFKVQGSEFKVQGSEFKVQGSEFKVQSFGQEATAIANPSLPAMLHQVFSITRFATSVLQP